MTNYISKEGLADLQKELIEIREVELPKILDSINKALAEGDLRENSALDSAKLERDNLVARESEIQTVLLDYQLIEEATKTQSKVVRIGGKAKVKYLSNNTIYDLTIVGSSEADGIIGKISNESPLAKSILGKKEGSVGEFTVNNNIIKVEILEILG
jgi:transcription elongation factor GreA